MHVDKYASYEELSTSEIYGTDYRVHSVARANSPVLILAPHGGQIEEGTSELAGAIAGEEHSLFLFEGLKPRSYRSLHITSHRFDHPECLELLSRSHVAIAVHGCSGDSAIYVGGLDTPFADLLTQALEKAGLPVLADGHRYPGRAPQNICNRTLRQCGAQLELTMDLRGATTRADIAAAVRGAIAAHLVGLRLG